MSQRHASKNQAFYWLLGLFIRGNSSITQLAKYISSSKNSYYLGGVKQLFEKMPFIKQGGNALTIDYLKFLQHYQKNVKECYELIKRTKIFKSIDYENFEGFLTETFLQNDLRSIVFFPLKEEIGKLAQSRSHKKEEIKEDFFIKSIFLSPFIFTLVFYPIVKKWDELKIFSSVFLFSTLYSIDFLNSKIDENNALTKEEKEHLKFLVEVIRKAGVLPTYLANAFNVLFTLIRKYKIELEEDLEREYRKKIEQTVSVLEEEVRLFKQILLKNEI